MIKKITITDIVRSTASPAIGNFRMFNEFDVRWESGKYLGTANVYKGEFAEATCTFENGSAPSANYVHNIFETERDGYMRFNTTNIDQIVITFEFKDGFEWDYMSKFTFMPKVASTNYGINAATFTFYDSLGNVLATYKPVWDFAAITNKTVIEVPTPELMPNYMINKPQRVVTTDNSRLSGIHTIQSLSVTQLEPVGTTIRYAFSFDDRVTWKVFKGGIWSNLQDNAADTVHIEGMSKENIDAITINDWTGVHTPQGSIDVTATLCTSNKLVAPHIISVNCEHIDTTKRDLGLK